MIKKAVPIIMLMLVIGLTFVGCNNTANQDQSYLRIHIRANSNQSVDQNIKYMIKDQVVEYLTPYVANCQSLEDLKTVLNNNKIGIEQVADTVLTSNNFTYKSKASIKNEFFPTRTYEGLTLEANYYDALIIELGSGKGDNWWCVVYPPLCFLNGNNAVEQNIVYKSKIVEVINNFFK